MRLKRPEWLSEIAGFGNSRVRDAKQILSWEEFDACCTKSAITIASQFSPQSRIGLLESNSLDYLIALFAIIRAGCVAIPINTRLSKTEINSQLQFLNISALWDQEEIASLQTRKHGAYEMVPREELGEEDTAIVISSSGSDGYPKAVPLSLHSIINHSRAVVSHLTLTARDAWLVCLPFFHVGGVTIPFRCLVAGASVIISETSDPEEINKWIEEAGITFVSMVPIMLQRVLALRGDKPFPDSLRGIIVGGGPVPFDLVRKCHLALPTYGLTEACSMLTCAVPGCSEIERRSAGSLLPGSEVKIVDEQGNELQHDQTGHIIARGPGMAKSYWNASIKTARTFRDGWIWTGDIGRKDEHGYLHVLARRTDLIISGGENVYPGEIEQRLREHKDVETAVVLPMEDPEWGQVPVAVIVGRAGALLSEGKIKKHLEDCLAGYKMPKKFVFVKSLPLLPTGKPDLIKIKDMLK
jgi:o-succinylbenzoate---CoA ligase